MSLVVPRHHPSPGRLIAIGLAAAFGFALVLALIGSLLLAVLVGLAVVGVGAVTAWRQRSIETDLSRRRFLATMGATGLGVVASGAGIGRVVERAGRPNPRLVLDRMGRTVGAQGMEFLRRGAFPRPPGGLPPLPAPWDTANYTFQSPGPG